MNINSISSNFLNTQQIRSNGKRKLDEGVSSFTNKILKVNEPSSNVTRLTQSKKRTNTEKLTELERYSANYFLQEEITIETLFLKNFWKNAYKNKTVIAETLEKTNRPNYHQFSAALRDFLEDANFSKAAVKILEYIDIFYGKYQVDAHLDILTLYMRANEWDKVCKFENVDLGDLNKLKNLIVGEAYYNLGKNEEAHKCFLEAGTLVYANPRNRYQFAKACTYKKDWVTAAFNYENLLKNEKLDSNDIDPKFDKTNLELILKNKLGVCLYKMSHWKEASSILSSICEKISDYEVQKNTCLIIASACEKLNDVENKKYWINKAAVLLEKKRVEILEQNIINSQLSIEID